MALYEYACDTCKVKFEVIRSMNDDSPRNHTCGNPARLLISVSSFRMGKDNIDSSKSQKGTALKDFSDKNDWIDA